jgi:hypothetical protein
VGTWSGPRAAISRRRSKSAWSRSTRRVAGPDGGGPQGCGTQLGIRQEPRQAPARTPPGRTTPRTVRCWLGERIAVSVVTVREPTADVRALARMVSPNEMRGSCRAYGTRRPCSCGSPRRFGLASAPALRARRNPLAHCGGPELVLDAASRGRMRSGVVIQRGRRDRPARHCDGSPAGTAAAGDRPTCSRLVADVIRERGVDHVDTAGSARPAWDDLPTSVADQAATLRALRNGMRRALLRWTHGRGARSRAADGPRPAPSGTRRPHEPEPATDPYAGLPVATAAALAASSRSSSYSSMRRTLSADADVVSNR